MGRAKNNECYLYVVQSGETDVFKIGVSVDPITRLNALQRSNPVSLAVVKSIKVKSRELAYQIESALHRHFEKQRVRLEWFRLSHDDVTHIPDFVKFYLDGFERANGIFELNESRDFDLVRDHNQRMLAALKRCQYSRGEAKQIETQFETVKRLFLNKNITEYAYQSVDLLVSLLEKAKITRETIDEALQVSEYENGRQQTA